MGGRLLCLQTPHAPRGPWVLVSRCSWKGWNCSCMCVMSHSPSVGVGTCIHPGPSVHRFTEKRSDTEPKPLLRGPAAMHSSGHGPAQPREAETDPLLSPSWNRWYCPPGRLVGLIRGVGIPAFPLPKTFLPKQPCPKLTQAALRDLCGSRTGVLTRSCPVTPGEVKQRLKEQEMHLKNDQHL